MSSWERKGYRPHQASDDVSDDDTVEEVYNAKENKVEEMIRRFSKINKTEVATPDYQDEYNDDDRTMSSMSTMFRKARGDRHVSSEPLDYSTYQFDDDATMDSLSDVFKRQGTVDRRSPTVFQFKDDDNSTETVKTATTWKSRNRNHENGGLEGILRNKTNMHDEEEFGTINLHDQAELGAIENEKGKKNGNDGNNDDEQEKGSVKEEDLSQTKRAPRKKNAKKRSMSNRKFCCISFAFVAVVAISTFVTFQFYYKNWGKSDKFKTSDATPKDDQANLSPAVAPGRNGHSPTTQTNVGHIPSQPGNENDFEYVPSSSDVSKPVSRPVTSDVSRPIPVSVFDLLDRPTQKPATDYIGMLMEFLQDNQVYFDRDPLSPDFMAVQWLAEEAEVRETEENAYGNGLELTDKLIQRFAVITLDYALNRPNITMLQKQYRAADFNNYKKLHTIAVKDRDECKWHGVHCAKVGLTAGKVEEIRFSHSGLTGTIPPEINLLKDLKVLDLSGNRLRGAIPDSLYSIKQLEKLYLYQNQLTGTISENIKNWNNITHLHLSHNQLSGTIPASFKSGERIRPIQYMNLYSNQLTGTIPESLRFRKLVHADFGRNQFSGTLPDDFGLRSVSLRFLYMDHNEFTGTIPYSYTTLGNGRVEALAFNHNQLTGWVPGYYQHYKLLELNLHNNTFTGVDWETCRQGVFDTGEMVEFTADCDVCICDPYCGKCKNKW